MQGIQKAAGMWCSGTRIYYTLERKKVHILPEKSGTPPTHTYRTHTYTTDTQDRKEPPSIGEPVLTKMHIEGDQWEGGTIYPIQSNTLTHVPVPVFIIYMKCFPGECHPSGVYGSNVSDVS